MSNEKCKHCNSKLKKSSKKYCSFRCLQDFKWAERVIFFEENGYWFNCVNPTAVDRQIKKYLKFKRGIRCEICGLTEWMGKEIPLVLDHIDGNSEDSSLINVRLVCGNCDMQLSTYKSKNRGNGRHLRKKRYQNGKSY